MSSDRRNPSRHVITLQYFLVRRLEALLRAQLRDCRNGRTRKLSWLPMTESSCSLRRLPGRLPRSVPSASRQHKTPKDSSAVDQFTPLTGTIQTGPQYGCDSRRCHAFPSSTRCSTQSLHRHPLQLPPRKTVATVRARIRRKKKKKKEEYLPLFRSTKRILRQRTHEGLRRGSLRVRIPEHKSRSTASKYRKKTEAHF